MSEKTKEAIAEIKVDQLSVEEMFRQVISEFEENHGVIVSGISLERYCVEQMGEERQSILSRVKMFVAVSPELGAGGGK